jgi:hypothetical protein
MKFRIYRDWDARWRLRKTVIELYDKDGQLLDRCRCFGLRPGPLARRIERKQRAMIRRAEVYLRLADVKECRCAED